MGITIPSDESLLTIFKRIWLCLLAYPFLLATLNELIQLHVIPPHEICLNSSFWAESLSYLKWERLLVGSPVLLSLLTNVYFDFDDTPILVPPSLFAINNQQNAPPNPTWNTSPIKTSYISVAYLSFLLLFAVDVASSIIIITFMPMFLSLKAPLLALWTHHCQKKVIQTDNVEMVDLVSISSEGQKQWESETAL